ncbi:COPII coat Sec23p-Sfb3p heterodimer component, partial [Kappamyces sp. JEL0680]
APIPVVDFGKSGPIRCSRCQAYANPFFQFINGGRLFICNLCSFSNEVPPNYFSNLDMNGRRIDLNQRPELLMGSCEFAVQDQYCARPPTPVSYLFVVDVSWNAVQNGMLATFSSALKHFLYSGQFAIPAGARVGIVTFDRTIHFYNLKPTLESFQMMVVGDLLDVFSPLQEGLLVDPVASRPLVESLLDALPTMFGTNKVGDAALGSACKAGFEALKNFGGKMSVFQTMLPTTGEGVLKMRDDPKILGTDKEKSLFEPQEYFWTKLGQECAVNGVSIDLYLFPASGYIDVATVGALSALSGGEVQLYSGFDANRQGIKFANDLQRSLARTFGYDALLRIRISNGLKIEDYLGNFFMKNATDIECAGIDSLKSFACVLKHEGKLDERQDSFVQAALLYTTADGHRRVRVHNLAL